MNERIYYSEEARRSAKRQRFILAMAVASVSLSLGALIALLFAPDTGENIRDEIRSQLDELLDRSSESARQVANDVGREAEKLRQSVEERIDSARS